ncbi:prostatic acid phosphatase isoform X2 [Procambarus clarkii]|uniref:prostatic acid phosphatase isoform X2 n=1 Tax=Procambarus clarkii TaxID=6728 RepID=UPI001E677594|nr:prostatic acid phosphatase-like isoform X2 [Procambarus clarkii]
MTSSSLVFMFTLFSCIIIRPGGGAEYEGTLELVHLMYRHGDRAPITLYTNDPHKDPSLWPNGLAQLTKEGKARQYALGRWLRNRYQNFVSEKWIPSEVYVRSTDVDRTLMSASCNLAAFYRPDNPDSFFEKDLEWMPTPIHTTLAENDELLSINHTCPRIQEEVAKQDNLPLVKNLTDASQDLFHYLSQMTGDNISSIVDVDYLHDTLLIEFLNNLTLPKWTKDVLPRMKVLSDFSFQLVALSEELKRLRAGPIIKEIGNNMRKKVQGKLPKQKMYMYSAHDTTLSILLLGLGVFNNIAPPYATTVLIELHKIGEQRFVKMFLRNDTNMVEPPHVLTLPGCAPVCPLDDWLAINEAIIPSDWHHECNCVMEGSLPKLSPGMLTAVTGAVVSVTLLLIVVICNLHGWRQRTKQCAYQAVPNNFP